MRFDLMRKRVLALLGACAVAVAGWVSPAQAAAPGDPVRDRFAGDFRAALEGYQHLGDVATARARRGLQPLDAEWLAAMKAADRLLTPHERVFFPMMNRPWSREAAVFANLQGARMWLWSIHDGLADGAAGKVSLDVIGGKVRAELLSNFQAYLTKAQSLLDGGEFKGSYFEDTLAPVLADYCTYPDGDGRHRPDFADPHLFDDPEVRPASLMMKGAT
ncbi:MAG: hypothetical protein HZA24_10735 [Nitrospirae bacterium]|nr:hypothetical protein [Nitrospirota bacterium]